MVLNKIGASRKSRQFEIIALMAIADDKEPKRSIKDMKSSLKPLLLLVIVQHMFIMKRFPIMNTRWHDRPAVHQHRTKQGVDP